MTLLLLAVAIAPGLAIAIYVYKRDKYEKEPLGLLVKCFVFGALTGFPAGFAEDFTFELLGIDLNAPTDLFTAFYAAFFLVGFTEEFVKYWVEGGWGVAALRMFTAVPMHAVFGVLMGYYVGMAKFQGGELQVSSRLKGLGFAVLFHGAYDFLLFQDTAAGLSLLVFPLIIFAIVISLKAIRSHSNASPFKR